MYRLIRPLLFLFDPEASHVLSFRGLAFLNRIPKAASLLRRLTGSRVPVVPTEVMGLHFSHPIGLAAGLDKDATCSGPLSDLGFGFLELGTVTPQPQSGNEKPRLFRLTAHEAIINRMGFNSVGVEAFTQNLEAAGSLPVPIGINLGKNATTPIDKALDDYVLGMNKVYGLADYIAINISSPNTQDLRNLQGADNLGRLLAGLKQEQAILAKQHHRDVPLVLKIAPDLTADEITTLAHSVLEHHIDGVIATNTTTTRPGLDHVALAKETGGLSGRPLKDPSTAVIKILFKTLKGQVPIIGVGGISNAEDAWEKLIAGADLIQIYSAFIFQGPGIIKQIADGLERKIQQLGCNTLTEAVHHARKQAH